MIAAKPVAASCTLSSTYLAKTSQEDSSGSLVPGYMYRDNCSSIIIGDLYIGISQKIHDVQPRG